MRSSGLAAFAYRTPFRISFEVFSSLPKLMQTTFDSEFESAAPSKGITYRCGFSLEEEGAKVANQLISAARHQRLAAANADLETTLRRRRICKPKAPVQLELVGQPRVIPGSRMRRVLGWICRMVAARSNTT